jgi:septal ring factor EnvC (AmiA/AmiB activator)
MAKRARGKSRGSSALDLAEFGDFVEPGEHVQTIVLAAPSPTLQPRLVPPLATQQPLLDAVSDNHAKLTRDLLVAREESEDTNKQSKDTRTLLLELQKDFQQFASERKLEAVIKAVETATAKLREEIAGIEGEIASLKMTSMVLKDEHAQQAGRLDQVEGWILTGVSL